MTTTTTFQERLKTRMNELGMTKAELAKKTGFTHPTIHRYFHEGHLPGPDNILCLSDALNVTTDYLVTGKVYDTSFITNNPLLREFADTLLGMNTSNLNTLCDFSNFLLDKQNA